MGVSTLRLGYNERPLSWGWISLWFIAHDVSISQLVTWWKSNCDTCLNNRPFWLAWFHFLPLCYSILLTVVHIPTPLFSTYDCTILPLSRSHCTSYITVGRLWEFQMFCVLASTWYCQPFYFHPFSWAYSHFIVVLYFPD